MGNLLLLDDQLAFYSLTVSYYQYQEPSTSGTPTSGTGNVIRQYISWTWSWSSLVHSIQCIERRGRGDCQSTSVHQCIKWSVSVVTGIERIARLEQCNAIFRSSTVALYSMLQYYACCANDTMPDHATRAYFALLCSTMPCHALLTAVSCQAKPSRVYHA